MKHYTVEEVLKHVEVPENKSFINYGKKNKIKVNFDGDLIKVSSDRLILFKDKGCKCVACGIEGTYFKKVFLENPVPHFNLYATGGNGEPVLMTKDHIHQKSKGGKDCQENYQPMCFPCNMKKLDTIQGGGVSYDCRKWW